MGTGLLRASGRRTCARLGGSSGQGFFPCVLLPRSCCGDEGVHDSSSSTSQVAAGSLSLCSLWLSLSACSAGLFVDQLCSHMFYILADGPSALSVHPPLEYDVLFLVAVFVKLTVPFPAVLVWQL